jgi:arsenate reductase-like glutaredoxin family protein
MKTNKNRTIGFKKSRKPRYVTEERLQEFGKELSAEIRKDMVTEERLQEALGALEANIRKDMVTEARLQEALGALKTDILAAINAINENLSNMIGNMNERLIRLENKVN